MRDETVSMMWLDRRWELWFRQVLIGSWIKKTRPLLLLAASLWRRLLFRTTFIAITGSVGKTTAKELLASILQEHGRTFKTVANQNGPHLVALNILRVRPWHKYAVLEVATAAPGAMEQSGRVVRPDLTLVLAMRRTHSRSFATLEEHAAEKAVLVRATRPRGTAVLFEDDPRVSPMADGGEWRVVRFGVSPSAELRALNVRSAWPERLTFEVKEGQQAIPVQTQLIGEHWLPAVLGPIAAARALGVSLEAATRAVSAVPPFRGRLQPVRLPNGAVFLRDDYNGSLDTFEAAFDVLRRARAARRVLVMTDIADFEGHQRKRMGYAARQASETAELIVLAGEYHERALQRAFAEGMPKERTRRFFSLEQAADYLRAELREGDLVLLKGRTTDHLSRVFFAQFTSVSCWKTACPKTMMCDECWELGVSSKALAQIALLPPQQQAEATRSAALRSDRGAKP